MQYAIEVGSYSLEPRSDSSIGLFPEFGAQLGSIFIDQDNNTMVKLLFSEQEGLTLECEHKNPDRDIGNFVTVNRDTHIWVYYLPHNT